ncbi:thioesterase II family protein [Leptolyngbya sp. FACHB-261]|uniref:thioesterase II family protein n=1 Tax=Leptolyngbya sp. FACHB-261 TaxID=2692806 RepID=UPI001685B8AC|nr:thioesterase II family protein [Leptolyngbya sp. FACHB-261]MBD2103376.1 thioesterase [Leptolyngbya sp. FACHB-261]
MTTPLTDAWIKCFKPNPEARLRLFCFPHVGSSASVFRTWPNSLPPEIEVCGIQLPGRESRFKEALFTQIPPLVQALTPALQPYSDIPFAFFGHSLGALLSFEVARQLRAQQQPGPVHLFVSGRRAPQIPDRNPLLHTLPEPEFLEELRYLNGTPKAVLENSELMQLFLPVLRADFSLCGTYHYQSQPPLDCSISAFGGLEDVEETHDLLLDWSKQTYASFSLQMLPGDHFFLYSNQELLLKLSQELNQLLQRSLSVNVEDAKSDTNVESTDFVDINFVDTNIS